MSFKEKLTDVAQALDDCAEEANGLANKNLADVLRMGAVRVRQALGHPDIDNVDKGQDEIDADVQRQRERSEALRSGGNELFAATDPGAAAAREEANRRATFPVDSAGKPLPGFNPTAPVNAPVPGSEPVATPFPGAPPVNQPNELPPADPNAKHPGDPKFQQDGNPNPPPSQVDLNKDGTLKQAPLVLGTTDNRDGGENKDK